MFFLVVLVHVFHGRTSLFNGVLLHLRKQYESCIIKSINLEQLLSLIFPGNTGNPASSMMKISGVRL